MKRIGLLLACSVSLLQAADERSHIYVTPGAAALVEQGLAAAAPTGKEAEGFQEVSAPGIGVRPGQAFATEAPWIDSNGWRYQRGLTKANYAKLPAGSAPLAAAEAFAYGVDAILNPDPADLEELGKVLRFLKAQEQRAWPVMADVAIVDDGSPLMREVLNLLTRRNLLYRIVSAPDRSLMTVQLGTTDFPRDAARDPSEFAARVRAKVGDENRLLRIYGTSTVIARLTGDGSRARLILLAYGGNRRRQAPGPSQRNVRVRLLGRYAPAALAAYGAPPDAQLIDVDHPEKNTTEFSLPPFSTVAIVDLTVNNGRKSPAP